MTQHRYEERSDLVLCDFCLSPRPKWEWSLGEGRANLSSVVLNGEARSVNDADGLWAACAACDTLVSEVRSNPARLPALVARVCRRSPKHLPTPIRKIMLTTLYAQIVPSFKSRRALTANDNSTGMVATGTQEQIETVRRLRGEIIDQALRESVDPTSEE